MPIMAFTTTPTESSTLGGIISGGTPGGTIAGSIRLQEAGCVGRLIFHHIFIFRDLKPMNQLHLRARLLGSLIFRQDFLYIVVRHI